jgi:hypothetical protein
LNLAAGWASDAEGESLYPLEPGGERQHELSLRGGVNLVMYTLTGNYKSDQVHVRDLLERLVRFDAYQQECKSLRAAIKEGANRINAGGNTNWIICPPKIMSGNKKSATTGHFLVRVWPKRF